MLTLSVQRSSLWSITLAAVLTLTLSVPAARADSYEPNDDVAHATVIPADGTYSAAIDTTNDEDYYSFTTDKPFEQIHLTFNPPANDVGTPFKWEVTSADGAAHSVLIRSSIVSTPSPAGDGGRVFPFRAADPGTYYLHVYHYNALSPYTFTLNRTQAAGEPNDSTAQATPITPGVTMNGAADVSGDEDYYSFNAPNDNMTAQLKLTTDALITNTTANPNYNAAIIDAAGNTQVSPTDRYGTAYPDFGIPGANATVTVPLGTHGTYYVNVFTSELLLSYHVDLQISGGTAPPTSRPTQTGSPLAPSGSNHRSRCSLARSHARSASTAVRRAHRRLVRHPTSARRRAYNRAVQRLHRYQAQKRRYC